VRSIRRALTTETRLVRSLVERGELEGERLVPRDTFWPAQLAATAAIVLYFALPSKLTVGPTWVLPSFEALLLVGLVVATPTPRLKRYSPGRRYLMLTLTALVTLAYLVSLGLLVHYLLQGGRAGGRQLVFSGVVLWATNVLIFGVWYWEVDRGGPMVRLLDPKARPDFLFPQMSLDGQWAQPDWDPKFLDYLYVSSTNATAFSPTDTMPLTRSAKMLMLVQGVASLLTIGLIFARAVNILA
jgi:uncharacterized membrane protein